MSDHDQLLQAVSAAPHDLNLRLIYADWLEERGDVHRAEFIRVQIELASRGKPDDEEEEEDAELERLQRREMHLLHHSWVWVEEFGSRFTQWEFRRGFIERVEMDLNTSAACIVETACRTPLCRLRVTSEVEDLSGLAGALRELASLTALELWQVRSPNKDLLVQILQASYLKNLRRLVLRTDTTSPDLERAIILGLHSPHRSRIRELSLAPTNGVVRAIARSEHLRNLRYLSLADYAHQLSILDLLGSYPVASPMDVESIQLLANSPNMANLEVLDLSSCVFSADVWNAVLELPWLWKLERLCLRDARVHTAAGDVTLRDSNMYSLFHDRVLDIQWYPEGETPWQCEFPWKGQSHQTRQRHLVESMQVLLDQRQYDALEQEYRSWCVEFDGPDVARSIDELDWDGYRESLEAGFKQARQFTPWSSVAAMVLGLQPESRWEGTIFLQDQVMTEYLGMGVELANTSSLATFAGSAFPEAARIYRKHPLIGRRIPNGASLYVLAKTLAVVGKIAHANSHDTPIVVLCDEFHFHL